MFGLAHVDVMPLIYGVIIFLGILSMFLKVMSGQIMGFLIEVSVFLLVFKLHGGTMAGGFAATVAALLAGFILPRILASK